MKKKINTQNMKNYVSEEIPLKTEQLAKVAKMSDKKHMQQTDPGNVNKKISI